MGRGFTSGGQELECAVAHKIQPRKRYIELLPIVLKDKEAASLKVKGPLHSCLLTAHLPSGSRTLNVHL